MNENDNKMESTIIFNFLKKFHELYRLYQGQPEQKKNKQQIDDIEKHLDILLNLVLKLLDPKYIYNKAKVSL